MALPRAAFALQQSGQLADLRLVVAARWLHKSNGQTMHYIDIDWFPPAIALSLAALVIAALRIAAWLGERRARARTRRNIEHVLSSWDRDGAGSNHV